MGLLVTELSQSGKGGRTAYCKACMVESFVCSVSLVGNKLLHDGKGLFQI